MASPFLLERLRQAVEPDHTVQAELASGGMGSVYLGYDNALDRRVAIKLLRPELASAAAADRFLAEARILAGLHHPNVVQVYRVGEAAGLFFYVMEYLDGETLEEALGRGPLPVEVALKVGRDLLDGLGAAHRLGVVHRDVKPSNVMLMDRRALLTDFGIAVPSGRAADHLGGEGPAGTPGFMAPEQVRGEAVTPRSDIYSAGVVIYEAITGRGWLEHQGNWDGVPRGVAMILQRALAPAPEDRWPDTMTFRRALWRLRSRRYLHRTIAMVVAGLMLGAAAALLGTRLWHTFTTVPESLQIVIGAFQVDGGPTVAMAGDSLATLIRAELGGQSDFSVVTEARADRGRPRLTVTGRLVRDGPSLRVRVLGALGDGAPVSLGNELVLSPGTLPAAADSIGSRVLHAVWSSQSPIAASLPLRALPRSDAALAEFLSAERLVGQARWGEAYDAYVRAEALDSTCWLCEWRIGDVQRWLGMARDPVRLRRALQYIDSFPPVYRSLIHAASVPLPARLDTLESATTLDRGFFLPSLQLGDELFHRGPLVGRERREALAPLEYAARLRPDYAPAWEHLAWVRTAEGDSAGAVEALAALDRLGEARDQFSRELRALLRTGFAWRFLDPGVAEEATRQELSAPGTMASPELGAGPRLLASFDAPGGGIAMGRMLMAGPRADLIRSGNLAALLGSVTLGRLRDAGREARTYKERGEEATAELFVAELGALIRLFEPAAEQDSSALAVLARLAEPGASREASRMRAEWMYRLLRRRMPAAAVRETEGVRRPISAPFREILLADSLAARGDRQRALALTQAISVDLDLARRDPFLRSVIHLLRAEWYEGVGNAAAARRELRWHENTDLIGYPIAEPQAAEVDWAFATTARWRRALLLDRLAARGTELCGVLRGVERHWRGGDAPFAARADSARRRATTLGCAETR